MGAERPRAQELIAAPDDAELRFASRIIGKDLLKGLCFLVFMEGGPYEVDIKRMHGQAANLPGFAARAEQLGWLYQASTTDAQAMLRVPAEAETALPPAVAAALNAAGARAAAPLG